MLHPVQTTSYHNGAYINELVALRAYEVYEHLHGEQKAMITGNCRGGFSAGELIAFLYAHSFPKEEWRAKADEAFREMKNL